MGGGRGEDENVQKFKMDVKKWFAKQVFSVHKGPNLGSRLRFLEWFWPRTDDRYKWSYKLYPNGLINGYVTGVINK